MNVNNFFNLKLYLQAMKRLKVTGIVSAVCLSILAIIAPIIDNVNRGGFYQEEFFMTSFTNTIYESYIFLSAATSSYTFLCVIVYLIVPVMSIILFRFLTLRNGSDFYHSIPTKRRTIYLSFLAAIVTWSLILIAGYSIIMGLMYAILPGRIVVDSFSILVYTCNIFISCILVAAGFGLGCSLSGTTLSNLITSLCILLIPRLYLTIFCGLISTSNGLVSFDGMFIFTRYQCNMVFAGLMPSYMGYGYNDMPNYTFEVFDFSTIYTLVLAIIYIALGCVAFRKRPSETAGQSAISPKLQFTVRMLLGYSATLIIIAPMYLIYETDYYIFGGFSTCLYMILIYLGTFAAMFIYELISTKRLKKALKSLITAPLIIVANIVTIFILAFFNQSISNYCPDGDDINYVKFHISYYNYVESLTASSSKNGYVYDNIGVYSDTITRGLSDIKITDPEILEFTAQVLKNSIERSNPHDTFALYGYYEDDYNRNIAVTICDGMFETDRYLILTEEETNKIISYIAEHEKTKELYNSFPVADDSEFKIDAYSPLTQDEMIDVYNALTEDLKNTSPTEYHCSTHYSTAFCPLYVDYFDNCIVYQNALAVTNYTPKALATYLTYYNKHTEMSIEDLYEKIFDQPELTGGTLTFKLTDFQSGEYRYYYEYDEVGVSENEGFDVMDSISTMIDDFKSSDLNNFSSVGDADYYLAEISIHYTKYVKTGDTYTEDLDYDYSNGNSSSYYILVEKDDITEDLLSKFDTTFEKYFYVNN